MHYLFRKFRDSSGSKKNHLYFKQPHFCQRQKNKVLYMSSSFGLLRVESRDCSQAEKERTACKAEQIHKMTTIFTISSFFLKQLQKNSVTQLPTSKNQRTCRAPNMYYVHIVGFSRNKTEFFWITIGEFYLCDES